MEISADKKHQFKGQCFDCAFVAAKCANDDEIDCPYFAKNEEELANKKVAKKH